MSFIIFTIDFENNPYRMNLFMNYLAERKRRMQGNVIPMIGCYKGKREHSFICLRDDYFDHIKDTGFMKGQESILHVSSGNKQECCLEYICDELPPRATARRVAMGSMHEVCAEEAAQAEAWTYRPDIDKYWIARKGNPDGSLQISRAKYATTANLPYPTEQLAAE